jgi:hypothetical protein
MKASDVWIYLVIGALLLYWWIGYHGTVDLGANATVGGKSVDTRVKGPLETAPGQLSGVPPEKLSAVDWTVNPLVYV